MARTKDQRVQTNTIPDPRWTRGPVLVPLQTLGAGALARRLSGSLPDWTIEHAADAVAFTLETAPDDQALRTMAVLDLCDVLSAHTKARIFPLIEWALLPTRRAHRLPEPINVAGREARFAVLRTAAAPFFGRLAQGAYTVTDKRAFLDYHHELDEMQRWIISHSTLYGLPAPITGPAGWTVADMDAATLSLVDGGWITIGPSVPDRYAVNTATQTSFRVTGLGPRLMTTRGRALKPDEVLFNG